MTVDIGDVGEDYFSSLCSRAGLIRNLSHRDKTGWDHLIEFPLEVAISLAFAHLAPKSCYVQVKTSKKRPSAQIKGSNLVRMATSPHPYFIAFIVLNEHDEPSELYIKHFGQELIEAALKLRYEVDSGKLGKELHQVRRTINSMPEERVEPMTPDKMRESLGRYISPNMNDYCSWKSKLIKSAGFEQNGLIMNISSKRSDLPEKLVRMSLGYDESLEDFEVKHFIERFGFREEAWPSLSSMKNAKLTMPNVQPTAQGKASFRDEPLGARIDFAADLYMPIGLGIFPEEALEFRLNLGLVDLRFQLSSGRAGVDVNIDMKERYRFELLHRSLKLLKLLSKQEALITLRFEFSDIPLNNATISNPAIPFEQDEILSGLDALSSILSVAGECGEVFISCEDILKNAPSIHHALPIYIGQPHRMRAEFNVDEELDEDQSTTCVTLHLLKVGSIRLVGVLVLPGELSLLSENRYRVETEMCNVHRMAFLEPSDVLTDEQQAAMLEEAKAVYREQQVIVLKD
ncbi:hypothetical protein ACQ661_05720 [Pseudidiomarina sp. WS423]|uniref:hypothetical protein n=1 Tax=Pseudidiomarina sp. WS423 TaxID=3425124 RepID=UPI003D6FECBB